jgi:hypothetical protein
MPPCHAPRPPPTAADVRDMGQGSLEGSLRGELGLAAYSAAKAGWEPLLEPWQCRCVWWVWGWGGGVEGGGSLSKEGQIWAGRFARLENTNNGDLHCCLWVVGWATTERPCERLRPPWLSAAGFSLRRPASRRPPMAGPSAWPSPRHRAWS